MLSPETPAKGKVSFGNPSEHCCAVLKKGQGMYSLNQWLDIPVYYFCGA